MSSLIKSSLAAVFMATSIVVSGCGGSNGGDEPTPPTEVSVAVNPQSLELTSASQTATVNVKCSAEWSVQSDADWLTVRPSGGVANTATDLTVTVRTNTDMTARTGYLTIRCSGKTERVSVTQNPDAKLSLSTKALTFGAQASTNTLTVSANTDWTITSAAAWCKVTPAKGGNGDTAVSVACDENTGGSERTTTLTVTYAGGESTVDIKQMSDAVNTPEGYQLVWADEFNSGTMPNEIIWWYETGAGGWGNNEIQNYVAGKVGNDILAKIDNGILNIICAKIGSQIYSIRMNTRDAWQYGYFEARLKLPKGKGTWPAFWAMPKNYTSWPGDGEIDIMEEVGYHPNYVSSSIHCNSYNHSIGTQKTAEVLVPTAQEDFHVYALEWTADYIKTYVDGKLLFTFNNDKKGNKDTWPFNAPFYLKLNLAWGGNWGGAQGVDESCLPATYQVDYVRVFQKK